VAVALMDASKMVETSDRVARIHPESVPVQAVIQAAIGLEPPEVLGKHEHDAWKVRNYKGNILLRNIEEGLKVGDLGDKKTIESIWSVLAKVPVSSGGPGRKKKAGDGTTEQKPAKIGNRGNKTLSYTYIQELFGWLRAATGSYLRDRGVYWMPHMALPTATVSRDEFVCRDDVARMLWSCRGRIWLYAVGGWIKVRKIVDGVERLVNYIDHDLAEQARGLARALLLMVYTGIRKTACKNLLWKVHATRGHIDPVEGILYRVGHKELATNKNRKPTSYLLDRIHQHVRRWHAADTKRGYEQIVRNKKGVRYTSAFDVIFDSVVDAAGLPKQIVVHTLRHTCATWQAIIGVPIQAAADLIGVEMDTLEDTYRRWCPASQDVARKFWRDPENLARLKRVAFSDLPDRSTPDARMPSRAAPRMGRERKTRNELRTLAAANAGVVP
jgi:integrase